MSNSSNSSGCHQHRLCKTKRKDREHRGVPAPSRPARVPGVHAEREQQKQGAEDILAFGNPRDRPDVQRMNREERCHERAPSGRARDPNEKPAQQKRVDDVDVEARQMMAAGIEAEQLHVEHV